MNPGVSVIMPSLSPDPAFLRTALKSLADQTLALECEVLIIEAGNYSRTAGTVASGAFDSNPALNVNVLHAPKSTQWEAVSTGICLAQHEWLTILGTDDVSRPRAFEALGQCQQGTAWLVTNRSVKDAHGSSVFEATKFHLGFLEGRRDIALGRARPPRGAWIQQEGTFFRKNLLNEDSLRTLSRAVDAGDYLLWTMVARQATPTFHNFPLGSFRIRPGQKSEHMERYVREVDSIGANLVEKASLPNSFELVSRRYRDD